MPSDRATLGITDRELFERLGWFIQVRWAFGLFSLLVLMVSWHLLGIRLRLGSGAPSMGPAVTVVLLIFLYNAVFTFVVHVFRASARVTRRLIELIALAQIGCDLVAICALIHFTGGVENVFVMLILVPLVIATELLSQAKAYVMAAGAVVLLNALAWGEQQGLVPHVFVSRIGHAAGLAERALYTDWLYVLHVTTALTATIFAMVFIASTIAARLRAREGELERAYRGLHQADQAKSFFMRRAEHEMRAPLAAVQSILDAVALTADDGPASQGLLIQRAKHRLQALMGLVRDLRRYSRLQSDELAPETARVCLSDVVAHTVELHRKHAESAGVSLDCRIQPGCVQGDEEMLRELVTNLLANAVQYTPRGGRIDVVLIFRDGQAILTVADTGIGIGEKARSRLFEEFFRDPYAKRVFPDGTGLGLAIVKRILELHCARIDVLARKPAGTVFKVSLPTRFDQPIETEKP